MYYSQHVCWEVFQEISVCILSLCNSFSWLLNEDMQVSFMTTVIFTFPVGLLLLCIHFIIHDFKQVQHWDSTWHVSLFTNNEGRVFGNYKPLTLYSKRFMQTYFLSIFCWRDTAIKAHVQMVFIISAKMWSFSCILIIREIELWSKLWKQTILSEKYLIWW